MIYRKKKTEFDCAVQSHSDYMTLYNSIFKNSNKIIKSIKNVFKLQGIKDKDWIKIEKFVRENNINDIL